VINSVPGRVGCSRRWGDLTLTTAFAASVAAAGAQRPAQAGSPRRRTVQTVTGAIDLAKLGFAPRALSWDQRYAQIKNLVDTGMADRIMLGNDHSIAMSPCLKTPDSDTHRRRSTCR